jgi:hypothetical protein
MSTKESQKELIDDIRASLSVYPAKKEGILLHILRSVCLTLEVFLHRRIGERYLTWPHMAMGLIFIFFVGHYALKWDLRDHYLIDFGSVSIPSLWGDTLYEQPLKAGLIKYPQFTAREVDRVLGIPIYFFTVAKDDFQGVPLLLVASLLYLSTAKWRVLEVFFLNRLNVSTHNRSSGEPYRIWDTVYLLGHKTNFQIDLVKQWCEPSFCLLLAIAIRATTPTEFHFISVWLTVGSVALIFKSWLENRQRKQLFLDRVANEFDLEGVRIQQRFQSEGANQTFSDAG